MFSRRDLLAAGAAGFAAGAAMGGAGDASGAQDPLPPEEAGVGWSVKSFGAAGDGKKDDTAAIQKAIDATHEQGGGAVYVPRGNYLVQGHLLVKEHVALRGVWQCPTARTQNKGSTLLAVEGAGEDNGTPFITLHQNGTLRGLTVFYPEQKSEPVPYPWTIRGTGDNCSLIDVLLVNPYRAVDFGTTAAGRHFIHGLYAQALHTGVFVDQCFDVGRIKDVHLWPFWQIGGAAREFTISQATGFVIGRTDWEYVTNCFCIGYKVGFHFVANKKHGPGNAVLMQSGSDVGPCAVKVDAVQAHSGVSFCNSQMMAGVEIGPDNRGPLKFTACGFWPVKETEHQARLSGDSLLSFSNCHFAGWDSANKGAPCIVAEKGILKAVGCDFTAPGKKHVALGEGVRAASIVGNSFAGGAKIENASGGDVQLVGNCSA